jgi:hypothetical protein
MVAMRRPALLLLLLAWPALTAAAPRWFDLELLVFARAGPPSGDEAWPEDPGLPDTAAAVPPARGNAPLRLTAAADRLRRQPGYSVLLHTAWRQPTGDRSRAPWVRLADAPGGASAATLDGIVRLSVSRYLHLDLDLVLIRELVLPARAPATGTVAIPLVGPGAGVPAPPEGALTRVRQPFRLVDSRRMRSDEVHYIDHPAFGVLALVTAYQPPQPAAPDASTATEETAGSASGDAGSPPAAGVPADAAAAPAPAAAAEPGMPSPEPRPTAPGG